MVLKFNNTNPRVKFKAEELDGFDYFTVMPLYDDDSVAFIAYEGESFFEAWNAFTSVINTNRVIVPKQFEKFLK